MGKREIDVSSPKEMASAMSDYVNYGGGRGKSAEEFCAIMANDHRTLQQNFTNLCFRWIVTLSEQKNFDARNEYSVGACREIVEKAGGKEYLVELPFI